MEFLGGNCEGEWSSLSGMYTAEEADFMAQLLGNHSQTSLFHGHLQQNFTSTYDHANDTLFPVSSHDNSFWTDSQQSFETSFVEPVPEETCKNPRKRTRNLADVQRNKKNVKAKRNQKLKIDEEDVNVGVNVQSSSSSSDDDVDESHDTLPLNSKGSVSALNSSGKSRASRGSATDPQSLYARKRRERINERLRILQNLVPNGTKVDISTMLEEAVQYVKFLQLQIKLLSSDDMWMYAPIAYNGMDIGLDFNVPPSKS